MMMEFSADEISDTKSSAATPMAIATIPNGTRFDPIATAPRISGMIAIKEARKTMNPIPKLAMRASPGCTSR